MLSYLVVNGLATAFEHEEEVLEERFDEDTKAHGGR